MIQVVLINFIYFDILYTERWFPDFMKYLNLDLDFEDYPLNSHFNENGFQSLTLLKNIGSTFFFLIIYILLWALLVLFKLFSNMTAFFENFRIKLYSWLMWNETINLLMSQFTPIMMSSILNLHDLKWDSNVAKFSSSLSVFLSTVVLVSIMLPSKLLWNFYKD